EGSPDRITSDPYGEGWLLALRPSDPAETDALLDADAYSRLAAEE
ncbi:MAG: glycine cleavage system protein H, partial [Deltaproteobacteria bacterium]